MGGGKPPLKRTTEGTGDEVNEQQHSGLDPRCRRIRNTQHRDGRRGHRPQCVSCLWRVRRRSIASGERLRAGGGHRRTDHAPALLKGEPQDGHAAYLRHLYRVQWGGGVLAKLRDHAGVACHPCCLPPALYLPCPRHGLSDGYPGASGEGLGAGVRRRFCGHGARRT